MHLGMRAIVGLGVASLLGCGPGSHHSLVQVTVDVDPVSISAELLGRIRTLRLTSNGSEMSSQALPITDQLAMREARLLYWPGVAHGTLDFSATVEDVDRNVIGSGQKAGVTFDDGETVAARLLVAAEAPPDMRVDVDLGVVDRKADDDSAFVADVAMAADLMTNDLATNDLATNDLTTNDLTTNDLATNDLTNGCPRGICPTVLNQSDCQFPGALAVDSSKIYFTSLLGAGLLWIPLSGGSPAVLYRYALANDPGLVAANSKGDVCWVAAPSAAFPEVACNGSSLATSVGVVGGIAVDSTNVYWTDGSGVNQKPIVGGMAKQLATNAGAHGIAVAAGFAYFVDATAVWKVNTSGTPVVAQIATSGGSAIAVNGGSVYWMDPMNTIMSVGIFGGATTSLVSNAATNQYSQTIAADGSFVYWVKYDLVTGAVMKVPVTGGAPITLAANQPGTLAIAIDQTNVYWSNLDGNSIRTVIK